MSYPVVFEFRNPVAQVVAREIPRRADDCTAPIRWNVVVGISLRNTGSYREVIFQTLEKEEARTLCLMVARSARVMVHTEVAARQIERRGIHNALFGWDKPKTRRHVA